MEKKLVNLSKPQDRRIWRNQAEWLERRGRLGSLGHALRKALV